MSLKSLKDFAGRIFKKVTGAQTYSSTTEGRIYNQDDQKFKAHINGADREFTFNDETQELTNKTITNGTYNGTASGTAIKDEDNMVSDSATHLATQQSIKAYVDSSVAGKDDASEITYTPAVLTDWNGDVDPGNTDNALDQLAERVDDNETNISTNSSNFSGHIDGGANKHDASEIDVEAADGVNHTQADLETVVGELDDALEARTKSADLSSTANAKGASLVGIEDTAAQFTSTTVEGALAEAIDAAQQASSDLTTHEADTSTHGVTTVAGLSESQVFTNKDYDGGTASNTSRMTIPKDTKANLDLLTRKEGTIVYASDENKVYTDNGTSLIELAASTTIAASASVGSNQSISNATWTKLTLNTEQFDTNNDFDSTTNNRFDVSVSGKYQISAGIQWSNSSDVGARGVRVYKNGSPTSLISLIYPNQCPTSNWTSYTPTGSLSTNITYTGRWRRVGDSMEVQISASITGATDSVTITADIPSGFTIDNSKFSNGSVQPLGVARAVDDGNTGYIGVVLYNSTTSVRVAPDAPSGGVWSVSASNPFTWEAGDTFDLTFTVPISGWAVNIRETTPCVSGILDLVATDYIELFGFQESGAALNADGDTATRLHIHKI